jgi:dephospho-CoA kinase
VRPLSVALTGNIASGKSTVLGIFRDLGAYTTDADAIVRELQEPGTPVFDAIVARFGPAVVAPDGSLARDRLRAIVFADASARADLEALVHPAVRARRVALEDAATRQGAAIAVHDIPLLFESGDPAQFDRVVLVDAPEVRRRAWLIDRRGLDPAEADRMIAAQVPSRSKRGRSHYVIENDADLKALEQRTRAVWERLLADAARRA